MQDCSETEVFRMAALAVRGLKIVLHTVMLVRGLAAGAKGPVRACANKRLIAALISPGPRVAVDASYATMMSTAEHKSFARQLSRLYAANRAAECPFGLYICGYTGSTAHEHAPDGYEKWLGVENVPGEACAHFSPEEIIYLSPDSPHTLSSPMLDEPAVFVIGGLVDRSVIKGVTLERAERWGVRHARLPLREHIRAHSLPPLPMNAVMSILINVRHTRDWASAIAPVIPTRWQQPERCQPTYISQHGSS